MPIAGTVIDDVPSAQGRYPGVDFVDSYATVYAALCAAMPTCHMSGWYSHSGETATVIYAGGIGCYNSSALLFETQK
ncbi:hypothetical protein TNCV_1876381 [Trichonephila clavipes]|nr:hypothetical protein TNCV_1876381 [Trichonephila clavipes]